MKSGRRLIYLTQLYHCNQTVTDACRTNQQVIYQHTVHVRSTSESTAD